MLFLVAIGNLISKQVATIYGVGFTAFLFVIFTISEKINMEKLHNKRSNLEQFNLDMRPEVTADTLQARPGCILVAVRDYNHMVHLKSVLEKTNLRRHDIVVMTVRPVSTGAAEYDLSDSQLFSDYEKELLTRVVTMAEKEGKHVDLLVVPGVDPFDAMVQTAAKIKASRLVTGVSARMDSEELARKIGLAWEKLPEPRHPFSLEIITPGPAQRVCEPGTASAPAMAGRPRPRARSLAAGSQRISAPGCIIAMWWAWRCGGCRKTSRVSAMRKFSLTSKRNCASRRGQNM